MISRCTISISALLIGAIPSLAQDGHYWTQQYGTRSILLSGSVIGGVDDLGAVYYNPGRLSVITNAAFLLSANVYEYNALKITDAFGSDKNANKSSISGVPTLAAGTFKIKSLPKHYFAYAILTRQYSDLNFSYQSEVHKDVIASLPGDEYFSASISLAQKSQEQWIGLTWSHPISSKISIGLTTNYSTNNQNKVANINMQALSQANEVAVYRYNRNFSYKQTGLLWKAGMAANLGKWDLGLTVTTPFVRLSGTGTYTYEEFLSSVPGLNTKPETYSTSYQRGLSAQTRTPWSVGVGASRKIGKNKMYVSAEWYDAVAKYTLMRAADHISQSNPGDTIRFQLVDQAKSVLNVGIGTEIYLSEKISGFASFSTDFSSVTNDITRFIQRQDVVNCNTWISDFYHIGGGVVLKLKGADITLGATHTGANQTIPRPINFPENSNQPIFNSSDTANLQWDRWRFVFAFSFPFLKDYASGLMDGKKKGQ